MLSQKRRAVAIWLLTGVFMIVVQVLLGGITRLTESGLSITEWKPVTGVLPPLNDADWQQEFDKYKQIGQFKFLNPDFSIDDFKFIFFWEWFHRVWARLLGVVFLIGFVYFLVKKYFDREMVLPLIFLFLLGAMQGLIGWIMVASGLNEEDVYVDHIKLSMHFIAALILLCYTLWFALKLLVPEGKRLALPGLQRFTIVLLLLFGVQLSYGAFMAGLKAAPYAPTWPLLNGVWVPDSFPAASWVSDHLNVQFIHRKLAYLLATLTIFWTVSAVRHAKRHGASLLDQYKFYPLVLVLLQIVLGIFTVLVAPKMGTSRFGSYELLAEAHQVVAMLLLMALVVNLYGLRRIGAH